jgi:peroxiredoxin
MSRLLTSLHVSVRLVVCLVTVSAIAAEPPKAGDEAKDFTLKSLKDETVKLSDLSKEGPVVILVLRGYPGYQCPICNRQIGEFLSKAKTFAEARTQIVMVYPGPADKLAAHADEFVRGKTLPENCHFVIDPDYAFVNAYNLRWDAPGETAYPATFVIDKERQVRFAKISMTHGGRSKADEVLKEVRNLK